MRKYGYLMLLILMACIGSLAAQNRQPGAKQPKAMGASDVLLLTEDQESEVLNYLKENDPDKYAEAEGFKTRKPQIYKRYLSKAFREMRFALRLKEEDPQRFKRLKEEKKLERQSRELARTYRQSTDAAEKQEIETELKAILEKSFQFRQFNRSDEIAKLEEKLIELREKNKERLDNREKIIELRLQQLLGKQNLSW